MKPIHGRIIAALNDGAWLDAAGYKMYEVRQQQKRTRFFRIITLFRVQRATVNEMIEIGLLAVRQRGNMNRLLPTGSEQR